MGIDLRGLGVGTADEFVERAERDLAGGGQLGSEGVAEAVEANGRARAWRQATWKRLVTLLPSSGLLVCGWAKTRWSSPL